MEHPSPYGSLPFLDVLIHPVYRKPAHSPHTILFTKYSSTPPAQLHLLRTVLSDLSHAGPKTSAALKATLGLRIPDSASRVSPQLILPQQITSIKDEVDENSSTPSDERPPPDNLLTTLSLSISLPYHPSLSKPLRKILRQHVS